jgi:hypothetical protein
MVMKYEGAIEQCEEGTILHIQVIPNAQGYSMEYDEWRHQLKIRVKAPPKGGKANKDLLSFLSRFFSHPEMISGKRNRYKKIFIPTPRDEIVEILGEFLK